MEFMRKYIHVAKIVKPMLTPEAANHIAEEYSSLRSQDQMSSDVARVCGLCRNVFHHQDFSFPFYVVSGHYAACLFSPGDWAALC